MRRPRRWRARPARTCCPSSSADSTTSSSVWVSPLPAARVNHAHFTVNGKKVNIPSYIVKVGDVIEVSESSRDTNRFKAIAEADIVTLIPKWLEKNDKLGGKVIALPQRDDIDYPVEEHLIVELYSK